MNKPLLLALFVVTTLFIPPCADACGDKMMALGRGVRFNQAYKSPRPAQILIFLRPGSRVQQADKKVLLQSSLASAGHHVRVAQDLAGLDEALRLYPYDLVIADSSDAAGLEREAQASPSKPLIVPVLYKPSKAEDFSARSHYFWVLKTPGKIGQLLVIVDSAMEHKSRMSERSVAQKM